MAESVIQKTGAGGGSLSVSSAVGNAASGTASRTVVATPSTLQPGKYLVSATVRFNSAGHSNARGFIVHASGSKTEGYSATGNSTLPGWYGYSSGGSYTTQTACGVLDVSAGQYIVVSGQSVSAEAMAGSLYWTKIS